MHDAHHTSAVGPCACERGFTLVELMVACVLIGIALAMAGTGIMTAFSGSSSTASTAMGRQQAAEAAERAGADIRVTRSTGRDGAKVVDPVDLKGAIESDGKLYDLAGGELDWRDISEAAPNLLTLQADVIDEGGSSVPECVNWSVVAAPSGWYIRRQARAYTWACAGGGGAVLEDDDITRPTKSLKPPGVGTPPLFTYTVSQPAAGGCSSILSSGPIGTAQRNRIVSIRVDFSAIAADGGGASRAALRDEISIRSRSANDYQYAMGCNE